jgi:hypothetical protein
MPCGWCASDVIACPHLLRPHSSTLGGRTRRGSRPLKKTGRDVPLHQVHSMGMLAGKTFNSQQGGATSDKLFYQSTLQDWLEVTTQLGKGSPRGGSPGPHDQLDFVMVESWYYHPLHAAPETQAWTTTFTAKAVFDRATSAAL